MKGNPTAMLKCSGCAQAKFWPFTAPPPLPSFSTFPSWQAIFLAIANHRRHRVELDGCPCR
jgi:hypothetical protein